MRERFMVLNGDLNASRPPTKRERTRSVRRTKFLPRGNVPAFPTHLNNKDGTGHQPAGKEIFR